MLPPSVIGRLALLLRAVRPTELLACTQRWARRGKRKRRKRNGAGCITLAVLQVSCAPSPLLGTPSGGLDRSRGVA